MKPAAMCDACSRLFILGEDMKDFDELWPGGPRFKQDKDSFRLSTDSVLLADFVNIKRPAGRVLDLGSGAGVLCVLLAAKYEGVVITGIELQPEAAALSRENLSANGLEERVEIITADLCGYRNLMAAESFDAVVTNPPFFSQNSGQSAPKVQRAISREEKGCTLSDICAASKWALRWGGLFYMVHRPERLSEIFCAMTASGIEPKRLRFVHYTAERAPSLVLIEGRRGGSPGISVRPPLVLKDGSGGDSDEVQRIYRRGSYSPD